MAHIFDVMGTVNGNLNLIFNHYQDKKVTLRTISAPDFLIVAICRAIDTKDPNYILIDPDAGDPEIVITMIGSTGDDFNPAYIAVAKNLKHPIIDRVPVMINHNDISGPGVAYIVIVPEALFENDTTIEESAKCLKELYFGLLEFDPIMKFKVDAAMIRYSENTKYPVPTYDLMMAYIALGCININLKSWYRETNKPISSKYTLLAFNEGELDEGTSKNIIYTLEKHAIRISSLRDSLGDGSLLLHALYDVEEK